MLENRDNTEYGNFCPCEGVQCEALDVYDDDHGVATVTAVNAKTGRKQKIKAIKRTIKVKCLGCGAIGLVIAPVEGSINLDD